MECVQGALKSGFGLEATVKTESHQVLVDEFWVVNGVQNAVAGDDFFVDNLLDFSNGFSEAEEQSQVEELEEKKKTCAVSQDKLTETDDCITTIAGALRGKDEFESLHCSEISVPAEGLESLEWLSHFVEDSFSEYPLTGEVPPLPAENQSQSTIAVQENICFTTPVQTKARTKRVRTGNRAWPGVPASSSAFTESSTSSSSSISSTTSFSPPNPFFIYPSQTAESLLGEPWAKKQKKKPTEASPAQARRCNHCGVTKTPQWRAGPLGSKTLCNACGVRFKSGRLLPEYRPACSPTFSNELHSNHHRKVLEMRRKKDLESVGSVTGLSQPVQSF